jgi:hypothetical protein
MEREIMASEDDKAEGMNRARYLARRRRRRRHLVKPRSTRKQEGEVYRERRE